MFRYPGHVVLKHRPVMFVRELRSGPRSLRPIHTLFHSLTDTPVKMQSSTSSSRFDGNLVTSTSIMLTFLVIICTFRILSKLLSVSPSSAEPPYIVPKIPYIGHAIGLLQKKFKYYIDLRWEVRSLVSLDPLQWLNNLHRSFKHGLQIYSLSIPGMPRGRVYVINSPDLVLAVQRQPRKLSFWLIQTSFVVKMTGLSQKAAKVLQRNVLGEGGKPSLFGDGMLATHKMLNPCDGLNQMAAVAAQKIAASMDELEDRSVGQIELWGWVNHEITLSITESVYGPKNPFRDPEVEQAFL